MIDILESVSMEGFQVVNKQLFETPCAPLTTIWSDSIGFSAAAYDALENCDMVKILVSDSQRALMVVSASSSDPDAIRWKSSNKVAKFRKFSCPFFAKKLMSDWGMDTEAKYRCYGRVAKADAKVVLYFDFKLAIKLVIPKKA